MKCIIKIEFLILFLLCSIFIYLDYSFNAPNILMEHNKEISYSYKKEEANEKIIDDFNEISNENNVEIYYKREGKDKYYYASETQKTKEILGDKKYISNEHDKNGKEIKLPNSYQNIKIFSLSSDANLKLMKGTIIIAGQSKNVTRAIDELKIKGANIEDTDTVEQENSEYQNLFPIILIIILILCVNISTDILIKSKKISIMYLEGYTRKQVILRNVIFYMKEMLKMFLFIIVFTNILMYILMNHYFFMHYMKMMIILLVMLSIGLVILNLCLIRKLKIASLKNSVDQSIPIAALYVLKGIILVMVLIACANTYNFSIKYFEQKEQLKYSEWLDNYYSYEIYDDGFFNENVMTDQTAYKNLYLETVNDKSGIITSSLTCTISEGECIGENANYIVSPAYMSQFTDNLNVNDDTIKIFVPQDSIMNKQQILDIYNIENSKRIEMNYIKKEEIPIIDDDYSVTKAPFNSIVVLNKELIDSSDVVMDNMQFLIQNYYLKLETTNPYQEIKRVIEQNNLNEQIRSVNKINTIKKGYIETLQKRIKIQILIIITNLIILMTTIYINNRLYQLILSKKQAILILEGHSFNQINNKHKNITLMIYVISYLFALNTKNFMGSIEIISTILLSTLVIYLLDHCFEYYTFKRKIMNRINVVLKGEQ